MLLDRLPQAIDDKSGQCYPCVLNIEDLCRCELSWKAREGCAEGDAEIAYVILSDFAPIDLSGYKESEVEFLWLIEIGPRCVERVEQLGVKNTER